MTIRRHALFDFGGPLLLSPFELSTPAEAKLGVPAGSLPRGPFDPEGDPRWKAWQAGDITERQYWTERATPLGFDVPGYMNAFFEPSGNHLIRTEMADIVVEVQEAGFRSGLLTNDLSAFHGPAWRDPISVLKRFDPFVDLSMTGYLKPNPKAYTVAIEAMDADPADIVFIDDQPANVAAAERAGIVGVWFDLTHVASTIGRFRQALAA